MENNSCELKKPLSCKTEIETEDPEPDLWEFCVHEDGRDYGCEYFWMRATHPHHGAILRMWGWHPSETEIEEFKRNTRETVYKQVAEGAEIKSC